MEREVNVLDRYDVIFLELFNTPGTEIAPGSDEVGVKIECNWLGLGHGFLYRCFVSGADKTIFVGLASLTLAFYTDVANRDTLKAAYTGVGDVIMQIVANWRYVLLFLLVNHGQLQIGVTLCWPYQGWETAVALMRPKGLLNNTQPNKPARI